MRLRSDVSAASPMVVLTTFVIVAVLITVAVYALVVDRPEPAMAVSPVQDEGVLSFAVTAGRGDLPWADVRVVFLDRGGFDVAATYLHLPTGVIEEGDAITVAPQPPSGTYLLQVFHDGDELVRLAVQV